MKNILDGIENAAARLQNLGEKAAGSARDHLEDLKPAFDKAVDGAKDIFTKAGDSIEHVVEDARDAIAHAIDNLTPADEIPAAEEETVSEKSPTPFDAVEADVQAQLNQIRAAQNTPGVFSDYISKKFGNKEQ